MAQKRQYTLFGTKVDENKCTDSESGIRSRWNSTTSGRKTSDRFKYFIGAWMKALSCDYKIAKAWAFSRCGSVSDLDPTTVGDSGHGLGIWQWDTRGSGANDQNIMRDYVKGGYLPSDWPTEWEAEKEFIRSGKAPFETQVWAGIKYNVENHINKIKKGKPSVQEVINECGGDIGKMAMCFRGICSYGDALHYASKDGYMKVPFWAQVYDECLEAEGGQSQIPQVSDGDVMMNMGGSVPSDGTSPGGGGGMIVQAGYVSQKAPYTEVTWQPPIQGGVTRMFDASKENRGKIGMILGTHLRQRNLYGRKQNNVVKGVTVNKAERDINEPEVGNENQ